MSRQLPLPSCPPSTEIHPAHTGRRCIRLARRGLLQHRTFVHGETTTGRGYCTKLDTPFEEIGRSQRHDDTDDTIEVEAQRGASRQCRQG